MDSGVSMFAPVDMQATCLESDRLPPQRHRFGHPQTMPVHAEDERRITVRMAAHLAGCGNDVLDFVWVRYSRDRLSAFVGFLGGLLTENEA